VLQGAFAQQPLNAFDRIALLIKKTANPPQHIHIFGPIISAATAALQRANLRELGLPEAQHMLRYVQFLGDLANRSKGAGGLFDPPARGKFPRRIGHGGHHSSLT
jgi:hypothetical protein